MVDRALPQNIEAERAVLGAMLLNHDVIPVVLESLGETADAYYAEAHGLIHVAIVDIYRDGDPLDLVSLMNRLIDRNALDRVGGLGYITALTDAVPTSANAPYYAEIVRGMWTRRSLISACSRAAGALYGPANDTDAVLADLESGIFAAAQGRGKAATRSIQSLTAGARESIQQLIDGGTLPGLRYGFRNLDAILRPMWKGNYILLAARPSIGKTTLACNVAINVARHAEAPVLILSLEMSSEEIASKMLGIVAGLRMRDVERGKISMRDKHLLSEGAANLAKLPIHIDDEASLTALQLRGKVRQAVKDLGVQLVIIDYLQLMKAPGAENRTNEIAEISREIKAAAKEGGIPVIALSQLNRQAADGSPQLHNIRDGGAIEQDADIVVFLAKDETEPTSDGAGPIVATVAKQRNGATGEALLWFDKPTQRFRDYSRESEAAAPVQKPYRDDDDQPFDQFVEDHYEEEEQKSLW